MVARGSQITPLPYIYLQHCCCSSFLSLSHFLFLFPVSLSKSLMSSYQYPPPPQGQYYTPPPPPGGGYGPPPPGGGYYQPQYVHTRFVFSFCPG